MAASRLAASELLTHDSVRQLNLSQASDDRFDAEIDHVEAFSAPHRTEKRLSTR
jgi:hypothetical protein